MKTKKLLIYILISVFCILPFAGCFSSLQADPKAELLITQEAFTSVVESLTVLQRAGRFNAEETTRLTTIIHQGRDYLEQWRVSLEAGQTRPDLAETITKIIDELLVYETAKRKEVMEN